MPNAAKYEAAVLILDAYTQHTEGNPRYDEPERFLRWLHSNGDRSARWRRFAAIYQASDEEAIAIAVGLKAGDPKFENKRKLLERAKRIDA